VKAAGSDLTYCTNIHPGESWEEISGNLRRFLPSIKHRVSGDEHFGIGLRLSAVAAQALCQPAVMQQFSEFMADENLYVATINGFPYGPFHGARVKEGVYLPDWRDEARLDYSNLLADLFAQWLSQAGRSTGSISTVPGAFKPNAATRADVDRIVEMLIRHAAHLVSIERATGCRVVLALEPEPCCFLETIDETVRFFRDSLHSPAAAARLAQLTSLDRAAAERALRSHLGVCLDLCHAAVEFESAAGCVDALESAGIAIAKIQVTAGLRVDRVSAESLEALRVFDDAIYLHQVVERRSGGALIRYSDLGEALASTGWCDGGSEWRIHFHVPVFIDKLEGVTSTQGFVREMLQLQRRRPRTAQLEVETYTWSVLPAQYRDLPLEDAIARELDWVRGQLA
jgi:sugar phosphate isomerase/epimerase